MSGSRLPTTTPAPGHLTNAGADADATADANGDDDDSWQNIPVPHLLADL
jgi:hypothetical protein